MRKKRRPGSLARMKWRLAEGQDHVSTYVAERLGIGFWDLWG
jgi:hypothetical protein